MIRKWILLFGACCCACRLSAQQADKDSRDRTILQLATVALYVHTDATVPLDTALIIRSSQLGLSRLSIIGEGLDPAFCARYGGWVNNGNIDSFRRIVVGLDTPDRLKANWLIGAWYAFQPGDVNYRKAVALLTATREEARRAGNPEMEAQSDCLLSKAYYMLGDTVNGDRFYFTIVANPAFSRLASIQAKARTYVGIYAPFSPQMGKLRLDCQTDALRLYQSLGDTGSQVSTLVDIAYKRFVAGDVNGSRQAALQSQVLGKAWHFPWSQDSNDLLAYLQSFVGDNASALKYAMAELDAVERTNDQFLQPSAFVRLGMIYAILDNPATATEWYKRAMQSATEKDDSYIIYKVLEDATQRGLDLGLDRSRINYLQDLLKKSPPNSLRSTQEANLALANAYADFKDYLTARRYYSTALQLDEQISVLKGGMRGVSIVESMAWINFQLGEYSASRKYLMTLLSPVYEKVITQEELSIAYDGLQRVDSALGNYASAYHYLMLSKRLHDKIFTETQTRQMIDLNVKYETLQKEKLLQLSEAKRQLEAQKEAGARKLFYGGFVLLGALITMIYIRYYNNRRKNRQLTRQKKEIDDQNEILHELNDKQTVLLEEKEWLLREIHHRVKNNLQIIASLLSAQSEFLDDQSAIKVIADSQSRVKAMSLIHQKLYNSQSLSTIDMPEYIGDLVTYLRDSFDWQRRIAFNLEIAKIRLDVSKAVPLGLILNEAITNAFKYAFADMDDARISIRLATEQETITLEVSDNGRGLTDHFDISESNSFGMILMKGMAEDLEGNFMVRSNGGTTVSVSFMNSVVKAEHPGY